MAESVPIPEPPGYPLIGNLGEFTSNPLSDLNRLADTYGPIFRLRLGAKAPIFVSSNSLINEVCDEKRFKKTLKSVLSQVREGVHDGLFTAFEDEPNWGKAHRILVPAFGPLSIRGMFPEMHDIATQLCMKFARHGPRTPIDASDNFTRLALDTLALCAMDFRFNSYYKEELHPFIEAMGDFLTESGNRNRRPPFAPNFLYRAANEKFYGDIALMKSVADEVVAARKASPSDRKDLLAAMLNGVDPQTGEKLSDENITNQLITFLIAGHETTSGTLSFAMYQLLKNPDAYSKVQKEVDEVVGRGPVLVEHLTKLPYISAVLRETLRLNSPITAFGLEAIDDTFLGGKYLVKKGEIVTALLSRGHVDPVVYGNDADKFIPERMLDDEFARLNKEYPNCWKPFGNGKRACIGRPFAWQESLLAMVVLFQNFNFTMTDPNYALEIKQTLTIKPDHFYINATLRHGMTPTELEHVLAGNGATSSSTHNIKAAANSDTKAGGSGKPMAIFYGSNSGTCEALANRLASDAPSHGFSATTVGPLDQAKQNLPEDRPVVIVTASYEGQPPSNAAHFIKWMEDLNGNEMEKVSYAVFACGHHDWIETFHRIPKLVDSTLEKRGGTRLVPMGSADAATSDMFSDFEAWEDTVLWPGLKEKYKISDEESGGQKGLLVEVSTPRKTSLRQDVEEALVVAEKTLTKSGPAKKHIEIQLPSAMTYKAGDYLAILPLNPKSTVARVFRRFSLAWDSFLKIQSEGPTTLPTNVAISAFDVFSAYVELSQPATKRNILALAEATEDKATIPKSSLLILICSCSQTQSFATMATSTVSSSSSYFTGKSDEEIEEMLDRMLTRLALCDDPQLENLLLKLLPVTISSLSRPSSAVRTKVMEILSHVNKRVKHQQQIGLPLEELWELYMEANAAPMVRNFCIVYIEMAFDRVSKEKKENIAPTMIANISKLPPQHQDIVFRIVIKVIGECHSSKISDEIAAKYKLISGSQDKEMFVEFCLYTLLYQPSSISGGSPPGLSVSQSNRVAGKTPLNHDMLLIRKLGLLNVIDVMELPAELVYPLYVAACVDRHEPVIKRGEELLKKKTSGVQLENSKLINRLFLLFNGNVGAEHIAQDLRVSPGNPALRVRLMSVFCRSITAANSFPSTLQCIFGCIYGNGTTSRLKQLGMEFTVWVFKHAEIEQLKLMGPVILSGVLKSLDGYTGSESDTIARETKTFAFQAIGLLAKRLPQLFRDKIDMAVRLFNALKLESPLIRLIVQEATNSLAVAYKDAPKTVLIDLESLLLENSQVEQGEVRFCALRWATTLFDSQHCPSRFICMLGAADTKLDIREMALEGLYLGKDQSRSTSETLNHKYPKLSDMLDYIVKQQPQLLESSEIREERLLFPSQTYIAAIRFLLQCFEADVDQKIATETSVGNMCLLLEHAMAYEGSVELHATASKALIEVASHFPEVLASRYAVKVPWLKLLLAHVDLDTRECAARLLGIASCALPMAAASDLIHELISSIKGSVKSRFEIQHGILCALGYVSANCLLRTPTITDSLLQNTLKCLVDVVNSESSTLASVAMQGLGHIGLSAPLPKLVHDTHTDDVLTFLREKLSKILSGDDTKSIQRIVLSLGHMCVKESSSSIINEALDLIFSLARSKVEDILFAAGEALSFLWGGVPVTTDMILKTNYSSLSMTSNYLMADIPSAIIPTSIGLEGNEECHVFARDTITKKLFDSLLYSTKKEERCSGTVWLVSLTMYCGQHPSIQQLLPDIQEAFSHLIGEQNELTQELASQGLSIVYELGDESMKKNLVSALVGTLTGTGKRKRAVKLVEDTEVFQEGSIGGTLSGGKLSTYKELCNLANEMGQPDLIYKFMDLANHQASLNSKRGAAFGFSKIAKLAGDALQPYLRQLVPRLVRYQYDPDKNVQDAMAHIWKSLVADSKKTIDEYLDLIIEDMLVQCGSRLWRSREASCLALADLIQGRKFNQVGKHLKNIWTAAFRAMDDIKETVRKSGERLCRAVTSLTLRLCDISLTEISDAKNTMDIVLPLLLTDGIMSKVDDIRKSSITIVTKLAKGAGIAIRPHLSELVCCMLESLSSLEDQGLNYVEMHAANAGIQTEKLENLRISIAKSSPLWETLDLCIDVVDDQSLEQLVPRLSQLARSGVGLNTRVGVASFISLLVQKVGGSIKPFTSTLLRLLFQVVKEEKSGASKRAFANSCAFVIKYAAPSQVHKLIEETAALYNGDRNSQIACALLLKSYASTAGDILSGYYATVVPVIFLSRFEDDKNVSSLYEELWEENMTSERLTLQLYVSEIVTLITQGIASSSWASKRKAAKAIVKLCEVLDESLFSYHQVLLTSLMNEIPGRIWEGKEDLLEALSSLCTSCHTAISAADPSCESAILNVVTSACSKKSKKFRDAGFRCLEKVLKAFKNPDFFGVVFPLMFEMCNSAFNSQSKQVSSPNDTEKAEAHEKEESSVPHEKIIDCVTSCVLLARLSDILKWQKDLVHVYLNSLAPAIPWIVKVSVFTSIKELCWRINEGLKDSDKSSQQLDRSALAIELFYSLSPKVIDCISIVKIAQVHIAASECLHELTKLYRDLPEACIAEIPFKTELLHQWEIEKNEQAKSYMKNCIDIIDTIQHKIL